MKSVFHIPPRVPETNQGIRALPGFAESLRILIWDERYSVTDVALMFGVTRERIRQLCKRLGIAFEGRPRAELGLFATRVWNDELNRFQPVSKGRLRKQAMAEERELGAARRNQRRDSTVARRRAEVIAAIKALALEQGRSPTLAEVASRIRPGTSQASGGGVVGLYWDCRSNYAKAYREMYAAAGVPMGKQGRWGRKPLKVA